MKACVMCGGLGTRLRPLTLERPKPLIPLLNKPSVVHLIEHLRGEGVTDVVMTLGYLGEMIEEAVKGIEGVTTTCVYEKTALGTAGGVRHAREHLKDGTFMVVGGDHVLDLQLNRIYRFHEQSDAIVTIGLICIDNPFEYGVCDMDARNVIHRFLEKPDPGEAFSNLINTGVYVCNPEILDWIPDEGMCDFAKDVFPALLDAGEEIDGYLVQGRWTDIGNHEMYRTACKWKLDKMYTQGPSPNLTPNPAPNPDPASDATDRIREPVSIGDGTTIGSAMIVGPVLIGEDTVIGDDVVIGPHTTIGSGCVIEDGAHILTSYIFDDVRIGKGSLVFSSILDTGSRVHENCSLETGTVLGSRAVVNNDAILSDVLIWHDKVVREGEHVRNNMVDQ